MSGAVAASPGVEAPDSGGNPFAVLRNRSFLLLWLSQVATQVGGNMVTYGLTILVFDLTKSSTAVSLLLLTFLVPAVVFSAVAGVFVDRVDGRHMLVVTNLLRAAAFAVMVVLDWNIVAIFALNIIVSILTTFFAPTELSMLPRLVPRGQIVAANSLFTLTTNAAFALGFALLGPLVVTVSGPDLLIAAVAICYLIAAVFCWTLPSAKQLAEREQAEGRSAEEMTSEAHALLEADVTRMAPELPGAVARDAITVAGEKAAEKDAGEGVGTQLRDAAGETLAQLREGIAYIRSNRSVTWSLIYLAIAASLIGVLGVLGPDFATTNLGLQTKDFVVIVLPLGGGVVMGVLFVNSYARLFPRRRLIEAGLVSLGILLLLLAVAGPIASAIRRLQDQTNIAPTVNVSLLSIVVVIAFLAGIAYAVVAIPSQAQLQEDLPEDVRGRVFGVLNMLVSIASFVPIIIVGPISDQVGSTTVIVACGILILVSGIVSLAGRRQPPAAPAATAAPGPAAGDTPGVL